MGVRASGSKVERAGGMSWSKMTLCSSRRYCIHLSPHRRFFVLHHPSPPPPKEIPVLSRPPSPKEFLMTFHVVGMVFFRNCTLFRRWEFSPA